MIYKLRFDREFYFSITIDVDELFSKMGDDFQFLDGTPRLAEWVAPKAEFYAAGNNQALEVPDVSDWLGNLVLSQKAYDALQENISDAVEFLPIDCQGESWYIVNVIQIEDAVDEASSERNIMNGELMGISKLTIDEAKLSGQPVFRIDFDERTNNYATEVLKSIVSDAHLSGIDFKEDLACF